MDEASGQAFLYRTVEEQKTVTDMVAKHALSATTTKVSTDEMVWLSQSTDAGEGGQGSLSANRQLQEFMKNMDLDQEILRVAELTMEDAPPAARRSSTSRRDSNARRK